MYNMAGKLRHKVDVYKKTAFYDDVGAVKYKYNKIKSVWCAVSPIIGERSRAVKKDGKGMLYTSLTVKFTMRINALKYENDMYFMYKGQRYDVDYSVPYFKDMQFMEVYCQLKVENDENLPNDLNSR